MRNIVVAAFVISFLFSAATAVATEIAPVWGPIGYLTEVSHAHYYANGSVDMDEVTKTPTLYSGCYPDSNPCRFGYVDVSLPNAQTVLQDIRLNVTGTQIGDYIADTNLFWNNDPIAKSGVAVSYPTARDRSRVYVNTSEAVNASHYNISDSVDMPALALKLDYSNDAGGDDIYDDHNVDKSVNTMSLTLTVTNPSSIAYPSDVRIQFEQGTGPTGQDVVDIQSGTGASSNGGTFGYTNNGGGSELDLLTWTGTVPAAGLTLSFDVEIEDGVNWASTTSEDLDASSNHGARLDHVAATVTVSGAPTMRTFDDQFTRGPVRQGIELSQDPSNLWGVRGFTENRDVDTTGTATTNNLSYDINSFDLYEIDPLDGSPIGSSLQTGTYTWTGNNYLLPGTRLYTTDSNEISSLYSTGSTAKPFFGSSFDWEVVWEQTASGESNVYERYINTTLDLPVLYKIDMAPLGTTNVSIAADVETDVEIHFNATHLGHREANASYVEVVVEVPANRSVGSSSGHGSFTIDSNSIRAFRSRLGTLTALPHDGTNIIISYTDPPGGNFQNGSVNVTIVDMSLTATDENLTTNDRIYVIFDVKSDSAMTTGDRFNFTGNITFRSMSGTMLKEQAFVDLLVSAKRLTGFKELIAYDPQYPYIVNSTLEVRVQAEGVDTIDGIFFVDYLPNGTFIIDPPNISVQRYTESTQTVLELTPGTTGGQSQYWLNISPIIAPDGTRMLAYNFTSGDYAGWSLANGDFINVTYQFNVSVSGIYMISSVLSGFDPKTGGEFGATAFGAIAVDVPESDMPLEITDEQLSLAKRVIVFNPALWVKTFEIFNPNQKKVPSSFSTEIFEDTMGAFVTYIDNAGNVIEEAVSLDSVGNKRVVRWDTVMNPLETRRYEVKVLTPPVTEVDRDVEVLEQLDDDTVKLKLDVFLKNLGGHEYEVAILNVPIGFESILEVKDEFGNNLAFTGGRDASTVTIPNIESNGLRTVSVIYKQGFPTVIATPDKDRYDPNSPVGIEILIINGPTPVKHPFVEIEVYTPSYSLVYADIIELDSIGSLEQTELYDKFVIPAVADDGFYIMTVRFRDGTSILSTHTGKFYVAGMGSGVGTLSFVIVIIIAVGLLFFSVRRLRETRRESKR
ncbi:MAG: hypothetical protein ABIH52_02820 [Candidatus Aenigmatarchaeota archaeon]